MLRSRSALTCPGGKLSTTLLTSRSRTETTVARGDAKVQRGMVSEKKEERIPLRFAFNCIKNALSLVEATRLRDFFFFFFFPPVDEG